MGEDLEFGMRDREGMCNEDWISLPPRAQSRGRRHGSTEVGEGPARFSGGDREIRNRRGIETEREDSSFI